MKKINIEELVRPNIRDLKPYASARDEFSGREGVFLDANENPFGNLNRYPDPHQKELKSIISRIKEISVEQIFLGNGSDEIIDLLFRGFAEPRTDKVIICPPTYGMYEVSANINDVEVIKVPLLEHFQLNIEEIKRISIIENPKLIFLCSPNNPTGNLLNGIEDILSSFGGLVVVDEAYIDFCAEKSLADKIAQYPNLIVMQTFSKARALAGARVGMAFAQKEIIHFLDKTKPPYNISLLNQNFAIEALVDTTEFEKRIKILKEQRDFLAVELQKVAFVKKIYPSETNFLLVEVTDATILYRELIERNVIIRNRDSQIKNCVRITVGTPEENRILLGAVQEIAKTVVL